VSAVNGSDVSLNYVAPRVRVEFPLAFDSRNFASFLVDFDAEGGDLANAGAPFADSSEPRGVRKARGLRRFHLVDTAPPFTMRPGSVGTLNLRSGSKMLSTPSLDVIAGPLTSIQL
jgi:hypothetical protein